MLAGKEAKAFFERFYKNHRPLVVFASKKENNKEYISNNL